MDPSTQTYFVAFIVVIATILYVICACLPSMEEIKEYFARKKKDKKEEFACPIEIFTRLNRMYPTIFTTAQRTNEIVTKIIAPKTYADYDNTLTCLEHILQYVADHKDELMRS